MEDEKIDFVITWVDGGDVKWQKERNRYAGKDPEDLADYRFRDWDNLRYWFRGVEKFAPWVNNIYFITNGQKPEWLNTDHPKLKWIKHEDYIPKEYLPTFKSRTIDLNFHRISNLEEKFVYFNDDMFIVNNVDKIDFFKNGLPKYYAQLDIILNPDEMFSHNMMNNAQLLNRLFKLDEEIKKNKKKWFDNTHNIKDKIKNLFLMRFKYLSSIRIVHYPTPILKSTVAELWQVSPKDFEITCSTKFRDIHDINQYIFTWYDTLRGKFESMDPKIAHYYSIGVNDEQTQDDIIHQKYKIVCLNDTSNVSDFEKSKKIINDALNQILPQKSSYEK